jgi:hypothetical protein
MRPSLKTLRRRYLKAILALRSVRSSGRDDALEVQDLKHTSERYLAALYSPSAWYRAARLSEGL